jgi:hypothetical protein
MFKPVLKCNTLPFGLQARKKAIAERKAAAAVEAKAAAFAEVERAAAEAKSMAQRRAFAFCSEFPGKLGC